MRLTVYGVAAPQGSMVRSGKGVRHSNGKTLLPWREAIAAEARAWLQAHGAPAPIDGPVCITATFYLPKPASARKSDILPTKKPDADKLIRAVADALTGIAYTDDARIVSLFVQKRYALDSPPRAEIYVQNYHEDVA